MGINFKVYINTQIIIYIYYYSHNKIIFKCRYFLNLNVIKKIYLIAFVFLMNSHYSKIYFNINIIQKYILI